MRQKHNRKDIQKPRKTKKEHNKVKRAPTKTGSKVPKMKKMVLNKVRVREEKAKRKKMARASNG